MATIPPGGITPVPDPITGGAGAPVMTANIVNAMWANSQAKSVAGLNYIDLARADAVPSPQMGMVTVDGTYVPPPVPAFPSMDPNNGEAIFDEKFAQMAVFLEAKFTAFIDEYFPNPAGYDAALAWCEEAITQGGSGIRPGIEQALWERDRGRLMGDSERLEDEALSTWAGRRFPLPPGALVNQVQQIRLDAGRKLAESSRTAAIQSFQAELDNVRYAVKSVLDQRIAVLSAAGDYIRTQMLAPQTAMQLATGLVGIQNQYVQALVGYYTAQVAAARPAIELAIADANIRSEVGKANLAAQQGSIDAKVRAGLQGAQLLAAQASAGINAINAGSSISGQDSSQI